MIPLKYTVEMEIPEEKMAIINRNPAGLKIDDIVSTRIETALAPLCGTAVLIYRTEEGKKPIDLFKVCPVCGHPWALHFGQVQNVAVNMSDGTPAVRGVLSDPVPMSCGACDPEKPCGEALKYGVK